MDSRSNNSFVGPLLTTYSDISDRRQVRQQMNNFYIVVVSRVLILICLQFSKAGTEELNSTV